MLCLRKKQKYKIHPFFQIGGIELPMTAGSLRGSEEFGVAEEEDIESLCGTLPLFSRAAARDEAAF